MRITAHRTRAALAVAGLTFCVSVVALSTDSTAAPASDIYISEFMASNNAGLTDEAGAFADWIEIRNAGTTVADLAGWQVQDGGANPFTFPTGVTIPAGGYLVIFSGNAVPGGTRLYTGFGLSAGGEALTLRRPDTSVAHAYTPTFPAQTANVSYGINNVGDERFFSTPTPGSANGPGDLLLTGAVTASPARGFYDAPINVTLADGRRHDPLHHRRLRPHPDHRHGVFRPGAGVVHDHVAGGGVLDRPFAVRDRDPYLRLHRQRSAAGNRHTGIPERSDGVDP